MQIHLCKPGGQQEGPYTLEQVKQDLAGKKYSDTDYWAWYEGLPEWVPLYALPGIAATDDVEVPGSGEVEAAVGARAAPPAAAAPAVAEVPAPATAEGAAAVPPATPAEEPETERAAARPQLSSGMPASALEQVFMFTTGDGPSAWQSPMVIRMMKEIVGEDLSALREEVERDVVAHCAVSGLLKPDGSISDSVWRAMAAHRPELIQQARERLYRVCVRTFRIEADVIVALVLFYNKQKL